MRSLAPYHGTCPDLHQGEVGYYAMVNGQAQWVQLPQERGHQAFDPDTYIRAMQDGSCTPIFSSINIGPLREWPRILFPELASYSIDVFRVVAVLYEMFLHRLPSQQHGSSSAVQIPTEIQLARIAIELLNSDNMRGAGETITAIVSEIASHDIYDPREYRWDARNTYRRTGVRSRVTGAIVDLSEPRDDDGIPIVDFQDVFHALAPLQATEYLACPVPQLFLNRGTTYRRVREDEDVMNGIIGPLSLKVRQDLRLSLEDESEVVSVSGLIDNIVNELKTHRIILTDKAVRRMNTTTIYFESELSVDVRSIYLTVMLYPRTHMHRFFINELTKNGVNRKHDRLYYRGSTPEGGEVDTVVYVTEYQPKTSSMNQGGFRPTTSEGAPMRFYSMSIEHTHDSHVRQFEEDLIKLLRAMTVRRAEINELMKLIIQGPNEPSYIVPPAMSGYTKEFVSKQRTIRAVSGPNRPIYIPLQYAGDAGLSVQIASLFAKSFNWASDGKLGLFVSVDRKIVNYSELERLYHEGKTIDDFSAIYVSGRPGAPDVVNRDNSGTTVLPWVTTAKIRQRMIRQAKLTGLPSSRVWYVMDLYGQGTDRTLIGTLATVFPQLNRTTLAGLAAGSCDVTGVRVGAAGAAALCKPEMFDHTTDEIVASFENPDTRLHYRLIEQILGITLFVAVIAGDDPYADIVNGSPVTLELPRRAGRELRDITDNNQDTMMILKYSDDIPGADSNWRYAIVYQSEHIELPTSHGPARIPGVPGNLTHIIDQGIRDEIYARHYAPHVAQFNFLGACHAPPVIHTQHFKILNPKSGLRCVHQSVNSDGYTTSITISGTLQNVVNSVLLLESKNARPIVVESDEMTTVTLCFQNAIIPVVAPVSDVHHPASDELAKYLAHMKKVDTPDGIATIQFGYGILITLEKNVAASPLILEMQRPMTILLSLMSWCMLRVQNRGNLEQDVTATVGMLCRRTQGCTGIPRVLVPHRFPPAVKPSDSLESAVESCIIMYFSSFPALDDDTLTAIYNYLMAEGSWIAFNNPPVTSIRYISGIHDEVPSERVYPSVAVRNMFRPASEGRACIVHTWKEYEYAVSRVSARQSMDSWSPFLDLSNAQKASDLNNHSCFVMKMPSGAVIYAFAHDFESGTAFLRNLARHQKLGNDYNVQAIFGFESLKNQTFTTTQLAMFNTSSAKTQGCQYRIHVFAKMP